MTSNARTIDDLVGTSTALVMVDLQTSVVDSDLKPHSGAHVVEQAERLITAVRAAGGTVVFVRHSTLPDRADAQKIVSDRVPGGGGGADRPHNWDEIADKLTVEENDPIVTKKVFNGFYGTDLDLQLRRRGIRTIVLAGVTTNFGVEGTARNALDHGYDVIVAEDACTSISTELHEFTLTEILPYLSRIRTVDEIESALAAAK